MRSAFPVPGEASGVPVQGPDLTRYLVVCALTILLVLALAALFRRFAARHLRARAARRSLQVLDVLPLGAKQKLVVVRCYDRSFLLGLGEKEVRSIAELDLEAAAAAGPASAGVAPAAVEFPALLERELHARPQGAGERAPARERAASIPPGGFVA